MYFPMVAMFQSAAGTALTLKESSYAVPLYMMHESMLLRISCNPLGTHKPFLNRGFHDAFTLVGRTSR